MYIMKTTIYANSINTRSILSLCMYTDKKPFWYATVNPYCILTPCSNSIHPQLLPWEASTVWKTVPANTSYMYMYLLVSSSQQQSWIPGMTTSPMPMPCILSAASAVHLSAAAELCVAMRVLY